MEPIQQQIGISQQVHQSDVSQGHGLTSIDSALKRKCGNALADFALQYLVAVSTRCRRPYDGYFCRHHIHGAASVNQLRKAVRVSAVDKGVTALEGSDIRIVQGLLGQADLRTAEISTHVIGKCRTGTLSPGDALLSSGTDTLFRGFGSNTVPKQSVKET